MTPYVFIRHGRRLPDSPYRQPCPICKAPAWARCITEKKTRRTAIHVERGVQTIHDAPVPDLSGWWRSMKLYEGKYAKPRPADRGPARRGRFALRALRG